jgi:DegV family protein with EDD domain
MGSIGVVTDSTADLPPGADRSRIAVVPLVVNWDSRTYRDKIDLTNTEFYQRLRDSKTLPKTGAPALMAFEQAFRQQLERHDRVVCVTIAGKLSATYDVACQAAQAVDHTRIFVVDSGTATICLGWLAEKAAQLGEQGAEPTEIARTLENMASRMRIYAVLDTLEFLQRGGRIGRAQALAGTLLNVKPILLIKDGEVHPVERVRTLPGAMRRLVQIVSGLGSIERLAVMHGTAPDRAADLERQLHPHFPHLTIEHGETGTVIGTHAGPGSVAVPVFLGR